MPNWVYNSLTITADTTSSEELRDLAKLVKQLSRKYTTTTSDFLTGKPDKTVTNEISEPFLLWNIVKPSGSDLQSYRKSLVESSSSPFWYDWNINNWGTKWEVADVTFTEVNSSCVKYTFTTAWETPVIALQSLSTQYPELDIELEWEEEQGFGAVYNMKNGGVIISKEWAIPSSHADMRERDRECYCETWDEQAFHDCFSYRASLLYPNEKVFLEHLKVLAENWEHGFEELLKVARAL